MRFTEFLVVESKMSEAHDILARAKKESGGISKKAILDTAERIAKKESPKDVESILKIIRSQLNSEDLKESVDEEKLKDLEDKLSAAKQTIAHRDRRPPGRDDEQENIDRLEAQVRELKKKLGKEEKEAAKPKQPLRTKVNKREFTIADIKKAFAGVDIKVEEKDTHFLVTASPDNVKAFHDAVDKLVADKDGGKK